VGAVVSSMVVPPPPPHLACSSPRITSNEACF
jgi:hypothetical protein